MSTPKTILVPLCAVLWENYEDWALTSIRGGQLNKMADGRSFREVALHSDRNGGKTADFTIATTLTTTVKDEDYAKSHVGGGYAYRESGLADAVTRNCFIFWSVL